MQQLNDILSILSLFQILLELDFALLCYYSDYKKIFLM